jgi:hypothetical protein
VIARGLVAEYGSADALLVAIRVARSRGYTALDAYTPYPVHGIDEALRAPRSHLSLAAGIGAACGALGAYFLQWLLVAYLYPVDVGGRPPHMPLPFLIITIEMGFLFGGLAVFFACLFVARMFRLWDPVCDVPGFESATRDGFWLAIAADDPKWNRDALAAMLAGAGARAVHGFGGIP